VSTWAITMTFYEDLPPKDRSNQRQVLLGVILVICLVGWLWWLFAVVIR
jgi:hypothetical protein